jgi:hypothetical protein
MMRRTIGFLTLLSALFFYAGAASADDTGQRGSIAGLDVNTDSADIYLQYHGRMFVKNSDGNLDEYRWGGSSCQTRLLTDAQLAALQGAQNNKKMTIEPRSLIGQGNVKCLVGFTLVEKKNLKLFP